MKSTNIIRAALAAVALAFAASLNAKELDGSVATVNGEPVLRSEYDSNVASVTGQYRENMPDFFAQKDAQQQINQKVLDQMIDDLLLYQQSIKAKIKVREHELQAGIGEIKQRFSTDKDGKPVDPKDADKAFQDELKKEGYSYQQFEERIKKQIMIRKYIDETVRPKLKQPTDEETKKVFTIIKEMIEKDTSTVAGVSAADSQEIYPIAKRLKDLTAERVRVRHILIKVEKDATVVDKSKALARANEAKKKIDGGAAFADVAKEYSDDAESAKRGGDIGFIIRGWLPEPFEKKAFSLAVGEVSDPVETPFGYHIIRVEEKKAAQDIVYDDVRNDLVQYLSSMQMRKELMKTLKELREKSSIKINN